MSKLVVANWKMNPESEEDARQLLAAIGAMPIPGSVEVVICPPAPYLSMAEPLKGRVALGAQDAFWADKEAATGEVSPSMFKSMGVKYVIVGHSERREKMHETDAEIWRKMAAVIRDEMRPILCVGEPWNVRREGKDKVLQYLSQQLTLNTASLTSVCGVLNSVAIAYEPVWAISTSGSGQTEDPADAEDMIREIRKMLKEQCGIPVPCVLYGGTVNSANAGQLLSSPDIDGVLVGKSSLNAEEFQKIIAAAG